MMKESPPALIMAIRIVNGVAVVVALSALSLHFLNWFRSGASDWPVVANISGLVFLTASGTVNPRSVKVRIVAMLIGILLIFPSAFVILSRS